MVRSSMKLFIQALMSIEVALLGSFKFPPPVEFSLVQSKELIALITNLQNTKDCKPSPKHTKPTPRDPAAYPEMLDENTLNSVILVSTIAGVLKKKCKLIH